MANNETTTKFKVDISELRAGMQEAKRSIAVANSEFKKASSSMDDWSNSTDGLEAKLKQLNAVMGGQKKQLDILQAEYDGLTDEQKQGSKAADDLIIKINNQQSAINKTEKEIGKFSSKLTELKSDSDKTGNALKDMGNDAKEAGDEADEGSGGFTILKGALADLVADGIRAAIDGLKELAVDGSAAYAQFAAATGTASESMGKWEDAIKKVYADNFGESLEDVAQKMSTVNQIMGDMSPDEMIKVTEAAITLEDTFGMDMTETLRGVQALMTHFGMTSEQALDFISSGAQNGLNYTDELGDNLSEYSGKFAEAGYSADEYFQLLKNGSDGGAYNLDKVNDAINEVTARLADGTIEKNMDLFSSGTQDVFKAWQDGGATQKEVIDSIVNDIKNTKGEQDKMNMAAAAFGTMAEDGGTKFISSLSSVGDSFSDVTGKAEELKNVKYDSIGAAVSSLGRTLQTSIAQPVIDLIAPAVIDFVQWCIDNIGVIGPIITGVAVAFGILAGALAIQALINGVSKAMAFLNVTMLSNPIVLVVAAVAGLIAILVAFIAKNKDVQKALIKAWNTVKSTVGGVVTALVNFFSVTIPNAWNSFKTYVSNFISSIVSFFKQLPGKIWTTLVNVITFLVTWRIMLIKKAIEIGTAFVINVVNFFSQLPGKVWTWLVNVASKVGSWGSSLASKGRAAASKLVSSVVNGIKSLPGKIKSIGGDLVKGLWNGIGDKISWLKNQIKGFVGNVKDWLKKFFKIGSPSKLMADEIGRWIPPGIGIGIEENTKPLYKSMKTMASTAISGLSEGADSISGGLTGIATGGIVNNYTQVINSPKQLSRLEIYRQSKNLLGYVGGVK